MVPPLGGHSTMPSAHPHCASAAKSAGSLQVLPSRSRPEQQISLPDAGRAGPPRPCTLAARCALRPRHAPCIPLGIQKAPGGAMRSRMVAVRCFAEQSGSVWEAHCVDLGLTVRGDSLERVKHELDVLVHRRLDDALVKRRPAARVATSSRRGAVALRLRYWSLRLAGTLGLR